MSGDLTVAGCTKSRSWCPSGSELGPDPRPSASTTIVLAGGPPKPMCSKFFCPTPESSNKDLSSGVEAGQPPVVVGGTVMLVEERSMLFSSK